MSQTLVDHEGAGRVLGDVDGPVGPGIGEGGLGVGHEIRVTNPLVAPARDARGLGRDLPVGFVDEGTRLEDGVARLEVLRRAEVAAGRGVSMSGRCLPRRR
jgi:hypothetical protein